MQSELETGELGVQWTVPSSWSISRDSPDLLIADEASSALRWWVFFGEGLHLGLAARDTEHRERAIAGYAHCLFEDVFSTLPPEVQADGSRAADGSWSPLVDLEWLQIGAVAGLRVVHRMAYARGIELVMGHLLIPVETGLLEIRCLGRAETTGGRECVLMMKEGGEFLTQAQYDDPCHDAAFAEHVLSRTRHGLQAVLSRPPLVHRAAGPTAERAALAGHTIRPPPGFVPGPRMRRVSFCVTAGVEPFLLSSLGSSGAADLESTARRRARALHEEHGVRELEVDLRRCEVGVAAIVRGQGHFPVRNVMLWSIAPGGAVVELAITSDRVSSDEQLIGELEAAARTLRPQGG